MFRLTVAHHDVLKGFLAIYSKIIGSISKNRKVFKRQCYYILTYHAGRIFGRPVRAETPIC